MNFNNKKVAVLGLGLEGRDLVSFLHSKGAHITVHDQKNPEELDLAGLPSSVDVVSGESYLENLNEYDMVYRSPGIYPLRDELQKVREQGKLSSAVKVFFEECPARIIGVTGTKGKGTTSSLIYDILKADGKDAYLAGNIGKPYLSLLSDVTSESWVILELSSFQLMDLTKSPHIAVVLNITTDHLDWHKDRNEYLAAKTSLVRFQSADDIKIVNADYPDSKSFAQLGSAKTCYFSRKNEVEGCFIQNNEIVISTDGQRTSVGPTDKLLLRGEHNWENVTAAISAAKVIGVSMSSIRSAVFSFKGLEHRLELVRVYDDVSFYNDSFATGPDTVIAAMESFDEPTTVIVGGFDKGLDYSEMAKKLSERTNIAIILIGDIADKINKDLTNAHFAGEIRNLGKPSMDTIVKEALDITPKGGVVLLSPGSSSFDMFASYKERGNLFKKAVLSL